NALQRRDLPVLPQTQVTVGDATLRVHAGRLEDDEAETAERETAQVHEMPVVGVAVPGRVLAHRRNHGAVAQCQFAQGVGGEELGHWPSAAWERWREFAHLPFHRQVPMDESLTCVCSSQSVTVYRVMPPAATLIRWRASPTPNVPASTSQQPADTVH